MSEVRHFTGEVRVAGEDRKIIEGYGALYGVRSLDMGFIETIQPGAFDQADLSDVRMLWNHNGDFILARTKSKTLQIRADQKGLFYSGQIAETSLGKDALISVTRGDVDQSSFAFNLDWDKDDEWGMNDDGVMERKINRIRKVTDVSPTAFPAYPQTRIDKRRMDEIRSVLQKPKTDAQRIETMIKIHKLLSYS